MRPVRARRRRPEREFLGKSLRPVKAGCNTHSCMGSGVEVSTGGGFGEEPFGFAVLIWSGLHEITG
jgi:hypothetical protein